MWHIHARRVSSAVLHLLTAGSAVVALTLLGLLGIFRVHGLPQAWQDRVKQELERRGVYVDYDRLYLNARGNLVLEGARLLNPDDPHHPLGAVSRVSCDVSWISWWRSEPFVRSLDIVDASLDLPMGKSERMRLDRFGARVRLDGEVLQLERVEADLLRFRIEARGTVPLRLLHPTPGGQARLRLEGVHELWRQLRQVNAILEGDRPVRLTVALRPDQRSGEEEALEAEGRLEIPPLTWRGMRFEGVTASVIWTRHGVRMPTLNLRTGDGGELRAAARLDMANRNGTVVFMVNGNPNFLAPLASGWLAETLRQTTFAQPPFTRAEVAFSWTNGFQARTLADLNWKDFTCRGSTIRELGVSLALEPGRVFLPEIRLRTAGETITGRLLWDGTTNQVRGDFEGRVNLASFAGFVPEGARPFFNSCDFARGADVKLSLEGRSLAPGDWRATGSLAQRDGAYKGVRLKSLSCDLETDGRVHKIRNFVLEKLEGRGTAQAITIDPDKKLITLEKVVCRVNPQEVGHMIGGEFEKYVQPYRFRTPPRVELGGVVDLQPPGARSKLRCSIAGERLDYPFLGVILPAESATTQLIIDGPRLTVAPIVARLHGGTLRVAVNMQFALNKPATTDLRVSVEDMDFALAMANLFKMGNVSGTVRGEAALTCASDNWNLVRGRGSIVVSDGYLIGVPFMIGLSQLLNAIIPGLGYTVANSATADFTVADGVITSENLDMKSPSHAIIGDFRYNFVKDNLDMDARVNVRGIVGVFLFPVSKLFEYHGTGSLKDTKWGPKLLGN